MQMAHQRLQGPGSLGPGQASANSGRRHAGDDASSHYVLAMETVSGNHRGGISARTHLRKTRWKDVRAVAAEAWHEDVCFGFLLFLLAQGWGSARDLGFSC